MAAAKKTKTARGRKQDRARVAGGQNYEVSYEAKKTGRSAAGRQEGRQEGRQRPQEGREAPGSLTSTEPACRYLAVRACSDPAGEAGEGGKRLEARLDIAQVDLRLEERESRRRPRTRRHRRTMTWGAHPRRHSSGTRGVSASPSTRTAIAPPRSVPSSCVPYQAGGRAPAIRSLAVRSPGSRAAHGSRRQPCAPGGRAGPVEQVSEWLPAKPCARQSTSVMLQPQAIRSKIGQYLSANFLSKPAVVRDRDHCAVDEGRDGGLFELVAGYHFVGDARDRDYFGRDRTRKAR